VAACCSKAVLYVNLSWMCCVCHVTVSRLVSINGSGMGGHILQKCLASPVFAMVVKLIHPLALCVQSVLKVW
jgi:hypothetical protein